MVERIELVNEAPSRIALAGEVNRIVNWLMTSTRSARAARAALVSSANRVLSILALLITIPLVLNHLGPERYGLWMTLITIFIYIKLADGGVNAGLVALVSRAHGTRNDKRIRTLFASAHAITLAIGTVLICSTFFVPYLNWHWLLGLHDPGLQSEASGAMIVTLFALALQWPTAIVRFGRLGLQQGAASNAWEFFGTTLTFFGQLAVIYFGFDIVALAAVTGFVPVLVNGLHSFIFFLGNGRSYRPNPFCASLRAARDLFSSGSVFLALTLTQALSVQIEPVLIARLIGVAAVADYSVVQRLFAQPQVLITLLLAAQFPAYGEALTRGDHEWIVSHFRQTLKFATLIVVILCCALALIAQPLIALWVGDNIQPSGRLIMCLAVYGIVAAVANVFTYFFFALGLYRRVIFAHVAMIAINVPLAIFLIPRLGAEGAAIATTFGYLVTLIGPSLFSLSSILRDLPSLSEKVLMATGGSAKGAGVNV